MSAAQGALDAIADGLSLTPQPPAAPGMPAQATLVPSPSGLNVTTLLPGTLRATWLTKEVLFKVAEFDGAMRTAPPDMATLNALVHGAGAQLSDLGTFVSPATGTPGLLGQVVAELPAVTRLELPVSVSVAWKVQRSDGTALPEDQFRMLSSTSAGASVLFAPDVVASAGGTAPATVRRIRAEVTLTITMPDGSKLTNTGAPKVLSVDVPVPALAVPTVLAMFNHSPFDLTEHGGIPGCVLVYLPPDSPFRALDDVLDALRPLAQGLAAVAPSFGALAIVGSTTAAAQAIGRLVSLLEAVREASGNVKLIVRASGYEPELHKLVFYQQFLYFHTCEDTFGSLLLVGMPGRAIRLWNARERKTDEGMMTVRLPGDALAAVIESLHGDPPACTPKEAVPTDGDNYVRSRDGTFGDRISSLEWVG